MKKNEKRIGRIEITNKNHKLTKYIILIILIVTGISVVTGLVTSVYVHKKLESQIQSKNLEENFINIDSKDVITKVGPSIVSLGGNSKDLESNIIDTKNTSGVIIDTSGIIMTNYSLIKDYDEIYVKLSNKGIKPEKATFLGYDKETDIALLKIKTREFIPIKFSSSNDVKEGDLVFALGNSIGDNYIGLITSGIITSTNHRLLVDDGYSILQTNAVMNYENYGGVLCNAKGEFIGLNSILATKEFNDENLYFAVGIDAVKRSVNLIIQTSNKLGIKGSELQNGKGFYVTSLVEDGVAFKAGIKPTDIIISINGKDTKTINSFKEVIDNINSGDKLICIVLREGKEKKIKIEM